MACREQGSHARGMYPKQDTSHMGPATVKRKEETDMNSSEIARDSLTIKQSHLKVV